MKEAGGCRLFPSLLQETAAAHLLAKLTDNRMAGVFPDTSVGGLTAYLVAQFLARNFVALAFDTPFFASHLLFCL
jgi:hypothetical protein